ncbi:MAG: hypothetical protein WCG16_13105 [Methylococcales bacterium]
MKQFNKTLLATALMIAGSATANAAIIADNTGLDQAYLVAYDAAYVNADLTLGRTYNRNLSVSFDQLNALGATSALLATDLTTDANWTAFQVGMTGSVKWAVVDGSNNSGLNNHTAFLTGSKDIAPVANIDPTVTIFDVAATQINAHAVEINGGLTGLSSLIKQTPDGFVGQADHSGQPFSTLWSGLNDGQAFSPLTAFGSAAELYKGAFHYDATYVYSDLGDMGINVTTQADITNMGTLTLSASGLAAPVAAVPLPGAVWLFGAGLVGMLRMNRRKSVQA